MSKSADGSSPFTPFSLEHELFRDTLRRFIRDEIDPYYRAWCDPAAGGVPREIWKKAARLGLVGTLVPEAWGGPGGTQLFSIVHAQEMGRSLAGAWVGGIFENDMLTEMLVEFGSREQKDRWFPAILAGDVNQALGLTEAEAGSDVLSLRSTARKDGGDYRISGQKVYISNGCNADLFYILARTQEDCDGPRHAMTMFLVEGDAKNFTRQRMDTLGMKAQGVAELFLDDVRVPASAIVGRQGCGLSDNLRLLFPPDRALSAARSFGAMQLAFDLTVAHAKDRKISGRTLIEYQNTQFKLAEIRADILAGQAFLDSVLNKLDHGTLDDETASAAKIWFADRAFHTANECLQLHGGYGYMTDAPISQIFTATRLASIYAGTSEVQKKTMARFF
ncbi:acyl-CoA dehydrogenase family protein [Sphingobium sp. JS3065]|uniref:acyl-CoA dehydrogenase family protein n=1 Tax=Sphingobium sp. JS3065 TaxID=2970925 RepID=UPI002264FE16|nr:acyl-CoA dehydrogenase family protein [Sphingobium sp. JS3065]UZW57523.1 acyl-CoA dehydrogenase family protein [Sphingobium sp. JS3065]